MLFSLEFFFRRLFSWIKWIPTIFFQHWVKFTFCSIENNGKLSIAKLCDIYRERIIGKIGETIFYFQSSRSCVAISSQPKLMNLLNRPRTTWNCFVSIFVMPLARTHFVLPMTSHDLCINSNILFTYCFIDFHIFIDKKKTVIACRTEKTAKFLFVHFFSFIRAFCAFLQIFGCKLNFIIEPKEKKCSLKSSHLIWKAAFRALHLHFGFLFSY